MQCYALKNSSLYSRCSIPLIWDLHSFYARTLIEGRYCALMVMFTISNIMTWETARVYSLVTLRQIYINASL